MEARREARIREVALRRQHDLAVVLENVHDPHNISAVLRSCDAVGVREIFVLFTDERLQDQKKLKLGKKTSGGAVKWVNVHYFTEPDACFERLRPAYTHILATHLESDAQSIYQTDLARPTALVFGNEHDGLSREALSYCTGNIRIPQMGMVRSLNISVACAVTLFEALRQRDTLGFYGDRNPASPEQHQALIREYLARG
jgi:tRNA (guanosine-2'-O-)-methyltransferase